MIAPAKKPKTELEEAKFIIYKPNNEDFTKYLLLCYLKVAAGYQI